MTSKPVEGQSGDRGHGLLLRAIESQVIPRLVLTHPAAPEAVPATGESASEAVCPAESEVAEFTAIVLRGRTEEATAFMRDLYARGVSADSLYLDLLAPSARYLGERWTVIERQSIAALSALTLPLLRRGSLIGGPVGIDHNAVALLGVATAD